MKTLCSVKEGSNKRSDILLLNLYEMSKRQIQTELRQKID